MPKSRADQDSNRSQTHRGTPPLPADELAEMITVLEALAANDEGAFKGAIRKLSAFGWKLFERVATAATLAFLQAHGVIPPAPLHGALPSGGE